MDSCNTIIQNKLGSNLAVSPSNSTLNENSIENF